MHRQYSPLLSVLVLAAAFLPWSCVPKASQPYPADAPLSGHAAQAPHVAPYFPPRGEWETRTPSQLGMDEAKLAEAVEWAKAQETDMPPDFSTQAAIFGRPLGPVPTSRAKTNGLILRHGYIVAEWGDTNAVDPSYSIAKSYLSTILGLTIDRGMIADITDPVARLIHDGGYDSPHNAKVTWEHHATQTSEWDGVMFDKPSTFIGHDEFGQGEMKPRDLFEPGEHYEYNDVRVNRLSLSLLRLWKRPLPDVLKSEIMDPIGASNTWVYHGYRNSTVDIDGTPVLSVSGGTRWGGGLWMSSRDHARFGLLVLRGGEWNARRLVSESWLHAATTPHGKNPAYGYLWWLNADGASPTKPTRWPDAPANSFAAVGAGSNTIWIDPDHDLVVVWRWHRGNNAASEFFAKIAGAVNRAD